MKKHLLIYLAMLASLLLLDGIWLGLIAQQSYQEAMAHIMRSQPLVWPWVVFYLFYPAAILELVIKPQSTSLALGACIYRGALLGATAYGAYNLTNIALLQDWPLLITIKDWLWGTVLTAVVATVGGYTAKKQQ